MTYPQTGIRAGHWEKEEASNTLWLSLNHDMELSWEKGRALYGGHLIVVVYSAKFAAVQQDVPSSNAESADELCHMDNTRPSLKALW